MLWAYYNAEDGFRLYTPNNLAQYDGKRNSK